MALSGAVAEAMKKTGGGGRAPALPDGRIVRGRILPTKKDGVAIERVPFAKDGPNASLTALNIRFGIPEGYENAGRNFFARVSTSLLFTGRDGAPKPSYTSLQLLKALGYDENTADDDTLAKLTDRELLGKEVALVLGVEDDLRFNEEGDPDEFARAQREPLYGKRNFVKFINPVKESTGLPGAPPKPVSAGAANYAQAPSAPAADPWAAAQAAPVPDPWAAAAPAAAQI